MREHRLAHGVVALVGAKTQLQVRLDGVGTAILQFIGTDLVQQADTATFLAQVEEHAAALLGDGGKRAFQLETAIAAQAEQRVAGQAFGMQAAKHRRAIGDVAHAQGYMFLAALLVEEAMHGEFAEGSRQFGGGDEHDGHRGTPRETEVRHCTSSVRRPVSSKCRKYLSRWTMNRTRGYERATFNAWPR